MNSGFAFFRPPFISAAKDDRKSSDVLPATFAAATVANDNDKPAETVPPKRSTPVLVPIRSLGPEHRERIAQHLLALGERDRYLRFGYAATDEQIQHYVDGLDFRRDEIFGIYNRRIQLIAMAHLALSSDPQLASGAEFGVSVLPSARGRGYGQRLFDRALMHARNEGVTELTIHALSENTAMLKIARNAGAKIERYGSETESRVHLTPATFDTRMTEIMEEQVAQTDYRLKLQAQRFWDLVISMQAARAAVRAGKEKMST